MSRRLRQLRQLRSLWPVAVAAVALASSMTLAALGAAAAQRADAFGESRNHPAIAYPTAPVHTIVTALNAALASGSVPLAFDEKNGYLRAVLEALKIPVLSQVLVYSQTSQQADKITPQTPRALYFSDTAAVGWVKDGDDLEVWAQDAQQGVVFYRLAQQRAAAPQLVRDDGCLRCHLSWDTRAVPGPVVLTTFPRKDEGAYAEGGFVDARMPLNERWGGWYVTGKKVPARQMGNLPLFMPKPLAKSAPAPVSLEKVFDTSRYLSPFSDVVALMVLDHQAHAINLITRLGWEARVGDQARVDEAAGELVDYLLFVDEAAIPAGGIVGSSGFAEFFGKQGPHDGRGRSLRELQLTTRLMRYPLSYMIYTPAFDALPAAVQTSIFGQLRRVLTGADPAAKYAHLSAADRQAILEILRDTKSAFRQ